MTELSAPWTGTATGDASLAPYDAPTEWAEFWRSLAGAAAIPTNLGGVFAGELNEMAASGAATPVVVATGRALAYGTWYASDAAVNVAVATPAMATRIDRIVLRKDWTAQTVRITRIAGVEGGGAPALTQTAGVTWDTPLWQASITTGGVITLTDERGWLNQPRVLDRVGTDLDIVNTAAETTLYTFTLPGNRLGTDKRMRLTLEGDYLNNSGLASQFTWRVKYGATTMIAILAGTAVPAGADRRAWKFVVELSNRDATNSQYATVAGGMSLAATPTTGVGSLDTTAALHGVLAGTAAEDSTAAQALAVTVQHDAANANLSMRLRSAVLEAV